MALESADSLMGLRFLGFFDFGFGRLVGLGFRESFASFEGGAVAGDVASQAVRLGSSHECFLGGGGELGVSELGKGSGESGFVGELGGVIPATKLTEAVVCFEGVEELAGVGQAVDALGEKGSGDSEAVFAGSAGPPALGQQGATGDHGADGDEEGGAIADGTEGRSKDGEELLLEDVGERGELLGQGELHRDGGRKISPNGHCFRLYDAITNTFIFNQISEGPTGRESFASGSYDCATKVRLWVGCFRLQAPAAQPFSDQD